MGHARSQAVTRPLLTAEAGVQTRASNWDFYFESFSFPYQCHSTKTPYLVIRTPLTLCKLRN